MTFAIKFKPKDKKRWWLATPRGHGTHQRIHAALWDTEEQAKAVVAEDEKHNPDLDFKVVPLNFPVIRRP